MMYAIGIADNEGLSGSSLVERVEEIIKTPYNEDITVTSMRR